MKIRLLAFCAIVVALLTLCGPAFAHHGSRVSYNLEKPATMKGTVVAVAWQNPHVFIAYNVKDDSGKVVEWGAEAAENPRMLMDRGWNKDSVKPGDEITITVFPSKAGTPRGLLSKLVINDKVLYQATGLPQ
jgi:Family of unknown function (DUF6152)